MLIPSYKGITASLPHAIGCQQVARPVRFTHTLSSIHGLPTPGWLASRSRGQISLEFLASFSIIQPFPFQVNPVSNIKARLNQPAFSRLCLKKETIQHPCWVLY